MLQNKTFLTIIAAALAVLAIGLFLPLAAPHPFAYDEADYMWAGKQGIWANAIDQNAIPFLEYVRRGLELAKDPSKRSEFSRFIRESGDLGMYRHYHGPMFYYWLATLHALGVSQETLFRGGGMFLHSATAFVILFGFWRLFPQFPAWVGTLTALLFLFNRTALVAATNITQHGMFTFWAAVMLVLLSEFARTRKHRWLWASSAALAAALATVETAAVLGTALVATILHHAWPLKSQWRLALRLFGQAALSFLAGLLLVWPAGLLLLSLAKGFMMLVYIAVYRKTFSPMGPLEFFRLYLVTSPYELIYLLAGVGVAFWLFWKHRRENAALVPWLAFTVVFFAVLVKITAPYTYYYAPLTMAFCLLSGYAIGMLSTRGGAVIAGVLTLLAIGSFTGGAAQYRQILLEVRAEKPYQANLLARLREAPVTDGRLLTPYQAVPTLHYYLPQMKTTGFDLDWTAERLLETLRQPGMSRRLYCEKPTCDLLGDAIRVTREITTNGPNGRTLFEAEVNL